MGGGREWVGLQKERGDSKGEYDLFMLYTYVKFLKEKINHKNKQTIERPILNLSCPNLHRNWESCIQDINTSSHCKLELQVPSFLYTH